MPWITYGSDFGGVAGWHTSGSSSDSPIDPSFDRLEQNGVAAVVWFLFCDGRGALTFDRSGYVTGMVPSFWADYHAVLAVTERHHLRVVWVLTDFEIGMPAQVESGVQERGRADLLEDPAKRHSLIKEALETILKDTTASNQVAGWIDREEQERPISGSIRFHSVDRRVHDCRCLTRTRRHQQTVASPDDCDC